MKKGLLILATLLILLAFFAGGCTTSAGIRETQQYAETGFTKVQVDSAFEVEINSSDSYSISVTAPKKLFKYITVEKQGDTLEAGMHWGWAFWNSWGFKKAKIVITLPELEELNLSGACKGTVRGFNSTRDFKLGLSGASSLNLEMAADDMTVVVSGASYADGQINGDDIRLVVSGASTVEFDGEIDTIDMQISGASHAKLDGLAVVDADIDVSGASSATTAATGTINVVLSGASTLEYTDSPVLGNLDITGASSIKKR